MASQSAPRRFSNDERAYLYARGVLLGVLVALYALLRAMPPVNPGASEQKSVAFLIAIALCAVSTVVFFAFVMRFPARFNQALMAVLPFDLVMVALLTFVGAFDDAFFPVCILIPVMYALLLRKRVAWMVGAATAVAYVAGHLFDAAVTPPEFAILVLKTISIPLITVIVADSVDKQRQREVEARQNAIERDSINARLQRRVAELHTVSEITELLHASLELDDAGPMVPDIVGKAIGVESCCIFVVDKEEGETVFSACVGAARGVGEIAPAVGEIRSFGGDSYGCISVFDNSRGTVLFCATTAAIEALGEEDRLVLNAVASELIVAVENSRLFKLTQRLAITDELTGLYNYRHLQRRLDQEIKRIARYGGSVSLLMIDLDHFKDFNDTHGHLAGDVALADFGEALKRCVRTVDLVARYGGEEFAVVLPETDSLGAYAVAEKIRETVSEWAFADADGVRCCQLTVSIGLATLPMHAFDKESLLREADDALYNAKNGGKNRVRTPHRGVPSDAEQPENADPTGA